MRGLTLVVVGADLARFAAALRIAATAAALGRRTRLFLEGDAVALLAPGRDGPHDLLATCLDLGAGVTLCQTGIADAALDLPSLDPRLEAGGLAMLLAALEDDNLVTL